eukprot:6314186-Pyramimonas_sp.AAC.1
MRTRKRRGVSPRQFHVFKFGQYCDFVGGDRRHLGGSGPPEAAIGALLSAQQRQQPLQYQQARAAPEPTGLVTTGAALHVQRRGKLYRLPLHLHAGLHRGARGDITMDARWIGCGDASSRRAGPGWR